MAAPATDAEIAAALRIAADDPRLATLSPALSDWLDGRIGTSPIPATIRKEGFIRLIAYIYDMPESAGSAGWSRPFINSGAAALFAPYMLQTASILDADSPIAAAAAANPVAGLTQAQVETLIIAGVKDFARAGSDSIALGDTDFADDVEDAVDIEGVSWDSNTRVLTLTSTNGVEKTFTIAAGDGASGLTQSEVDGRINILVPAKRRVPDFAMGDAGQVPVVAADGNSLVISTLAADKVAVDASGFDGNLPTTATDVQKVAQALDDLTVSGVGTPRTNAEIRAQIEAALVAGANVTITPAGAGAARTFTVAASGDGGGGGSSDELSVRSTLPAVAGSSVGDIINVKGELYELVASSEAQNVLSGPNQGAPSGYTGDTVFQWDETSQNIRLYIPRAWLTREPPRRLYVRVTTNKGLSSETVLGRASADDGPSSLRTRWAYHRNPGDPALIEQPGVTRYSVFLFSDAAYKTPFNLVGRNTNHWQPDDRNEPNVSDVALKSDDSRWPKTKLPTDTLYTDSVQAPALAGNTERWAPDKLPIGATAGVRELMDGPGIGVRVTSAQEDVAAIFRAFAPDFDLDDEDKQHGLIEVEATVGIVAASSTTLGFDQETASPLRTSRKTGFTFASNVRAADVFLATDSGVSIATWRVYNGSAELGDLTLYLERATGTNNLGYSLRWDGNVGSALNWNFSISLTAVFLPSDSSAAAPAAPATGGDTYTTVLDWKSLVSTTQTSTGTVTITPSQSERTGIRRMWETGIKQIILSVRNMRGEIASAVVRGGILMGTSGKPMFVVPAQLLGNASSSMGRVGAQIWFTRLFIIVTPGTEGIHSGTQIKVEIVK